MSSLPPRPPRRLPPYRLALPVLLLFGILIVRLTPHAPSQAQFITLTPTPAFLFATPTPTPTEIFVGTFIAPSPTFEFCNTPIPALPGDTLSISPGVNIRAQPSASSALLANFSERVLMRVVGGPVCQGGFLWWNVTGNGVTGWVSEGRGALYWVRFFGADPNRPAECPPPLALAEGVRFTLNFNVRLRSDPGLQGRTITVAPAGDAVTILSDEPVCADGLNWWRARATVVGVVYDGWMAESDNRGTVLVDVPPVGDGSICDFPLNLRIGDRARVTYRDGIPKRLRNQPNLNATVLYDLVLNVPLEIVGGPVCSGSYNWWQVRVLASEPVIGWMAEGGPAQYWIAPVVRAPLTPTPFRTPIPIRTPAP